jgi:hypothetical protein
MSTQKYSAEQYQIETILAWVNAGEIAIPRIQRRELMARKIINFYETL